MNRNDINFINLMEVDGRWVNMCRNMCVYYSTEAPIVQNTQQPDILFSISITVAEKGISESYPSK